MKEENVEKVNVGTEIANMASGLLTGISPVFLAIPIVSFAINRVVGFTSEKNIVNRLKKIEKKLLDKRITIEEFREKVFQLSEHNEYIVKNNLNNLLLNCIPEIVDTYIEVIIDLIMKQENSIYEEICEIISSLNINDITLLKMIQEYKKDGVRDEFENNVKKIKEQEEENKRIDIENKEIEEHNKTSRIKKMKGIKFYDRNFKMGEDTIFWKDFMKTYELDCPELGFTLLYETINENGERSMHWAYWARSFLKLERLGIIQLDQINTVGTINSLNIDRFHITLFGLKLLTYI